MDIKEIDFLNEHYPYAMLVLNSQLNALLSSNDKNSYKVLMSKQSQKTKSYLTKLLGYNISKLVVKKKKTENVFISLNKNFKDFQNQFIYSLKISNKTAIMSNKTKKRMLSRLNLFFNYIDYIYLSQSKSIQLYKMLKKILMQLEKNGISIVNSINLNKLNNLVKKHVGHSKKKLLRLNVKFLLVSDEISNFEKYFLLQAAKELNVKSLIILHGYFNGNIYFPQFYDHNIWCWNKGIEKYFLEKYIKNIIYMPYPIDLSKRQSNNIQYNLLFISSSFVDISTRLIILKKLRSIIPAKFSVLIRLHPHELRNKKHFKIISELLVQLNFSLSNSDLKTDLNKSSYIVGFFSSVIYQASILNKKTLLISVPDNDYKAMEDISTIKLENFLKTNEWGHLSSQIINIASPFFTFKNKKIYNQIISTIESSFLNN